MLRLNCFIKTTPENRTTVTEAARKLVAESLREEGCVDYGLFISDRTPDIMMICETWADREALDRHSASEHFAKYVGIMRANSEMHLNTMEMPR